MYTHVKFILLASGLLSITPLAGCGGSSGSSSPTLITLQPRAVSATTANGLTATLSENVDVISQNGSVTYTLMLTNPTGQTVTMQLPAGCVSVDPAYPDANSLVTGPGGTIVYPAGPPPLYPCQPSLPPVTQSIAPGQTLKSQFTVSGQIGPSQPFGTKGTYTASTTVITSSSSSTQLGPLALTVQ